MKTQRRAQKGAFLGGPTVLTALMILCFAIFSLMALLRANSDLSMTQRAVDNTAAWYAADAKAEALVQQAVDASGLMPAELAEDFGETLSAEELEWSYDESAAQLSFTLPVDQNRNLTVILRLEEADGGTAVSVQSWQTSVPEETTVEEEYLPVFQ